MTSIQKVCLLVLLLGILPRTVLATDSSLVKNTDCKKIFLEIHKSERKITKAQTREFLSSLSCQLFSTSEGMSFGNKLLFAVLISQPSEFLNAYSNLDVPLQDRIITELKRPISDDIDVNQAYTSILNVKYEDDEKNSILNALEIAKKNITGSDPTFEHLRPEIKGSGD